MNRYALIVAGGKGTRMKSEVPKQYLSIHGMPILMHTLKKFKASEGSPKLILVIPTTDFDVWESLCKQYKFEIPHQIVAGGESRFQSVKNGLDHVPNNALVAIHDGVRPMVPIEVINNSYILAQQQGTAIASVPLKDSIRELDGSNNISRDRSNYQLIQTPQTFQSTQIKKAFEVNEQPEFTDDASVAEKAGHTIHLIAGSYTNIKITTQEDLQFAEALLKKAISE